MIWTERDEISIQMDMAEFSAIGDVELCSIHSGRIASLPVRCTDDPGRDESLPRPPRQIPSSEVRAREDLHF